MKNKRKSLARTTLNKYASAVFVGLFSCRKNIQKSCRRSYHTEIFFCHVLSLEQFTIDFNIDEETATDKFFSSKTFAKLANEKTEFYKKTWQEIYELLKQELE